MWSRDRGEAVDCRDHGAESPVTAGSISQTTKLGIFFLSGFPSLSTIVYWRPVFLHSKINAGSLTLWENSLFTQSSRDSLIILARFTKQILHLVTATLPNLDRNNLPRAVAWGTQSSWMENSIPSISQPHVCHWPYGGWGGDVRPPDSVSLSGGWGRGEPRLIWLWIQVGDDFFYCGNWD